MNHYDMFKAIIDYADKNELYDHFDDIESEWNEIMKKVNEWKPKVEKIYNEMKKEGVI